MCGELVHRVGDWGTTTAVGFAVQDLRLKRSGSQLVIRMHTHFKDNSARADYDIVDTMNRK